MIVVDVPEIKRLEDIACGCKDCISFSQGALRLGGTHESIKSYVRQILLTDKADYYQSSAGLIDLRKKLARSLGIKNECRIGIENILISHGATGALTSLCLTLLDQDDEVLLFEPTYPVYQRVVTFCKAHPVFVPAFEFKTDDAGKNYWELQLERIEQAITSKTKMIVFSNPVNPAGLIVTKEQLAYLKKMCEQKGIYLVVDEVYDDFIFDGRFSSVTKWAATSNFVIRVGSFSKRFAMSGWRVGYIVADMRTVEAVASVQSCTQACPTGMSQYGALYGLEHEDEIVEPLKAKIKKSKDIACSFFDELQARGIVSYAKPVAGFYIFFKVAGRRGHDFVMDLLNAAKVVMVPGKDFGPTYQDFIRLCFAREPVVVARGIKRLKKYFIYQQHEKHFIEKQL